MKKKVLKPNVVRGGTAVPLGANYYYMAGRKHKNGGIDVGRNPRTGLEVEDGEVMHIGKNEVKVFSSVPFLNGKSPAQKVMGGENPNKVFNQQEEFKDKHNMNDDGTKRNSRKAKHGGIYSVTINGKTKLRMFPSTGEWNNRYDKTRHTKKAGGPKSINPDLYEEDGGTDKKDKKKDNWFNRTANKVGKYISDNPETIIDGIGVSSNIIGGLVSHKMNRDMLNKLKYNRAPIARKAAKLKTRININPQLDKMRETLAAYERSVDNNTASSRVALARKQRARLANMLSTNELYGSKENIETELINKDKLNQQSVIDANIRDYNDWSEKKAAFDNAVLEKKAENDVSLINTINTGVQDVISRTEKRKSERQTRLAMMAANPNVNPRILKAIGIKGITNKDIEAYDKAYSKKKKGKKSSDND